MTSETKCTHIAANTLTPYTITKHTRTRSNAVKSLAGIMSRNVRYILDQLVTIGKTTSPATKTFCALLLLGHAVSYNTTLYNSLTLTPLFLPRLFYSFYSLATHVFVERRLLFCLLDVLAVCLCGKLVEPLWGSLEMVKFFALVSISTGFYTTIFYLLAYGCTFNLAYLFDTRIAGLFGYLAGISVAVKQIMPDHVLLSFRNRTLKLRNTHVPLLLFCLTLVLKYSGLVVDHEYVYHNSVVGGGPSPPKLQTLTNDLTSQANANKRDSFTVKYYPTAYPWMFMIGLFTSWVYLRFYQKHSNGTRGDAEDSFSFASFFPGILQPPIKLVTNVIFEVLIKVRVCKKPVVRRINDSSYSSVTLNLPGFDTHDAERRRLKAIKALNERLTKNETNINIAWPTLDDNHDNQARTNEQSTAAPTTKPISASTTTLTTVPSHPIGVEQQLSTNTTSDLTSIKIDKTQG